MNLKKVGGYISRNVVNSDNNQDLKSSPNNLYNQNHPHLKNPEKKEKINKK